MSVFHDPWKLQSSSLLTFLLFSVDSNHHHPLSCGNHVCQTLNLVLLQPPIRYQEIIPLGTIWHNDVCCRLLPRHCSYNHLPMQPSGCNVGPEATCNYTLLELDQYSNRYWRVQYSFRFFYITAAGSHALEIADALAQKGWIDGHHGNRYIVGRCICCSPG